MDGTESVERKISHRVARAGPAGPSQRNPPYQTPWAPPPSPDTQPREVVLGGPGGLLTAPMVYWDIHLHYHKTLKIAAEGAEIEYLQRYCNLRDPIADHP